MIIFKLNVNMEIDMDLSQSFINRESGIVKTGFAGEDYPCAVLLPLSHIQATQNRWSVSATEKNDNSKY